MKKIALLLTFFALVAWQVVSAQTSVVTGTVTSSDDGTSLPGVSVVVKGTTIGTVTDIDGKYSINVPDDASFLIFSFVGMATSEVAIEGEVINVALQASFFNVDEVVVTALGVTKSRKALSYSVQDVKGDEIAEAPETNVINSLQGKVSGAQITNSSGAVGASTRIVLRGVASLDGNNQPLFVVDGIPIANSTFGNTGTDGTDRGNGAADVNPDDIESISVLKGPNAAALYGSRAANGVVLIKTKSGSNVRGMEITVNHSTTFETPLRLPDYQNEYGQGSHGKFSFVDGAGGGVNDGFDESWGPKLDIGLEIPQFDSPVSNGVRSATPWVSQPDNVRNFFETGVTNNTNLSMAGNNGITSYRMSMTNSMQKGMLPNTDYNKTTLALAGSSKLNDAITISGAANYVHTYSENMPGYGYDGQNVMQQIVWFGRQVNIANLKEYKNADGSKHSWNYNYHNNPYFTLNENLKGLERNRMYGFAKADFKLAPWLSLMVRTGMDYYSQLNTDRVAKGDMYNSEGSYTEQNMTRREVNTDFLFSAVKSFGDIDVNFNLGGNRMDYTYSSLFGSADELAIADVYTLSNSKVPLRTSSYHSKKRTNSLFFSGQASYQDMIFLDVTGRNDWSSTLPEGNNSYFYPSVALAGVVTDLLDIESDALSFAKVRASWAQVGNDTNPYALEPVASFGDGWNAETKLLNMFIPNVLPNAGLKPEITTSLEIGADLSFFMNRVSLDLTYYNATSKNQIINIPISAASGYTSKTINAGEISNKGVEALLTVTPVRTKDFNWDITVNFAKNNNKVVALAEGVEQFELGSYWSLKVMAIPGETYGTLYGYDYVRNDAGDVVYDGGVPMQGDLKALGNYTPDWIGGIGSSFNYKDLTFSFLIDMKKGGDLYSMTTTWGRYAGILSETLVGREGGVVGNGVKVAADGSYVPNDVVVDAETFNKAAFSNDIAVSSVFDASFAKLREVKLGYTIGDIDAIGLKDLNVSLIGRNLAILWSKAPHIDPETAFSNTNVQGLEFGQIPSARSIGFNISCKF